MTPKYHRRTEPWTPDRQYCYNALVYYLGPRPTDSYEAIVDFHNRVMDILDGRMPLPEGYKYWDEEAG